MKPHTRLQDCPRFSLLWPLVCHQITYECQTTPCKIQQENKKVLKINSSTSALPKSLKASSGIRRQRKKAPKTTGRVSPIEALSHKSQIKAEAAAGLCFHGEGLSQAASVGAEQYFWRASALLGILRTTCWQLNHILARGQPSLTLYPQELQGMEWKPKVNSNIFRITLSCTKFQKQHGQHQGSNATAASPPPPHTPSWPSWRSAGPSLSPSQLYGACTQMSTSMHFM